LSFLLTFPPLKNNNPLIFNNLISWHTLCSTSIDP
jgi:hypothetical protein